MPGRVVRRESYVQEYHELTTTDGIPFVPAAVWKDIVFSGFVLLAIAACAAIFGPFGPGGSPIRRSSRPRHARISSSSGSMPCFRCCRPGWRRRRC